MRIAFLLILLTVASGVGVNGPMSMVQVVPESLGKATVFLLDPVIRIKIVLPELLFAPARDTAQIGSLNIRSEK